MSLTQVQNGMLATGAISSNTVSFSANTISGNTLIANTVSNTAFQTGSVENYMSSQGLGLGMRNRIINGDMRIDQRNAGANSTTTGGYTVDRWQFQISQSSKASIQQNKNNISPPPGFSNYLGVSVSTGFSLSSSDYCSIFQIIEHNNCYDFMYGTANAKTSTLSFWVYSSLTGTFGGALQFNGTTSRGYPFTYTISSANTWTYVSVVIPGDTTTNTFTGGLTGGIITVQFGLGLGSNYTATAGSWQSGNIISATGAVSVVGTTGATFYITGVQLEKGSVATPFEYRQYGQELMLCQRYFEIVADPTGYSNSFMLARMDSTTSAIGTFSYKVQKRAAPSLTLSGSATMYSASGSNISVTTFGSSSGTTGGRVQFLGFSGGTLNTVAHFDIGTFTLVSSAEL